MKITKTKLKQIIREEVERRLLNEEPSDYYKDYKSGAISFEEYQQAMDNYKQGSVRSSNKNPYTEYTDEQITALKNALAARGREPSGFLLSMLRKLNTGRRLNGLEISILKNILSETDPESANLF